jgi:energy-converting hydrogenase B subunit D
MNLALWALDLAFCGSLVWLAVQTLATPNLFKATVLFIVFGLTLALSWARLDAPDIALAEAAIGAGLTGALLLSTLASLLSTQESESKQNHTGSDSSRE